MASTTANATPKDVAKAALANLRTFRPFARAVSPFAATAADTRLFHAWRA